MGRAQDVPNAESYRYKVTSVIAILTYLKFSRFPHKDKSENTFIKICLSTGADGVKVRNNS